MVPIMKWAACLFLLAGCAGQAAPDDVRSKPDATASHEPEHLVGSSIVCPVPGTCIGGPGVAGRKILESLDGGSAVWVDASFGGGSGAVQYATDAGGLQITEGGIHLFPECDGGVLAKEPSGGPWVCTQGLGVNSLSVAAPITTTGPAYGPTIGIVASTDSVPGSMSAADKTKLDGIGAGAAVSSVTGTGVVTCSPTTGAVSCAVADPLPMSVGGLGAALSTCSSTDFLIAQSSTVTGCFALSGDCTATSGGVITCPSANASGTGALSFGASTGTISAASGATAPGLAQASTSGATGANMVDSPQASTNANGTPGSRAFNFAAPTGSGSRAGMLLEQAGTADVYLGDLPTSGATQGLWFGSTNVASRSTSNAFAYYNGTNTSIVAPTGSLFLDVGSVQYGQLDYTSGYFFEKYGFVAGALSVVAGGGTNLVVLANGTAPSSACTGETCVDSVANVGLVATSAVFDIDGLQPVSSGTRGSQITHSVKYRKIGPSSTGTSVVGTFAMPQGPGCSVDMNARVTCTNSLGACNGAGSGAFTEIRSIGIAAKNPAGTASILAGTPITATTGDTTTGLACVPTTSGANVILTCGDLANAATADWTIDLDMNCE